MKRLSSLLTSLWRGSVVLLVLPSSANYTLRSSSFGSGGGTTSSTNYSQNTQSGQVVGAKEASTNYLIGSGLIFSEQADVPPAPLFSNPSNYYNRLLLTINTGPNVTDVTYGIAVSSDGFATTQYVRTDGTLGATFTSANFQTYAQWGGSSGNLILGLSPHTAYSAKVSASHGKYTTSAFSPIATVSTSDPSIAFSLATTSQPNPPFSISFGSLVASTIITSPQNVLITFSTNAQQGGNIFLLGQNAGLASSLTGYTIASATTSLAGATEGFGAQVVSVSQTNGGPFTAASPYNGVNSSVGVISNTPTSILTSTAPTTGGNGAIVFKAKAAVSDPAAPDYSELVTVTASANF